MSQRRLELISKATNQITTLNHEPFSTHPLVLRAKRK